MERIPFCAPSISERDIQYVTESVSHCTGDRADDFQCRFEQAFADYIGVRYAFAVSSRTAAIHVALAALGLGPGQEVIVPDILPAASLLPLRYLGATPVFADIDARNWCLSAESFKRAITPRTKAVMPVHLYGNLAEMHRIRAVAHAHGIAIVEDASDALGGEYLGRRAGNLGDVGVFGFDRAETVTSGEGGMVVTDCDSVAAGIRQSLRDSGLDYCISPMQAALGSAQLERIDDLIARKRRVADWYRQSLLGVVPAMFGGAVPGANGVPCDVTLAFDPATTFTAEFIIEELALRGIECRAMFQPASSLSPHDASPQGRVARGRNRVSYAVSPCAVSLPSGTNLTQQQVERVATALQSVVARYSHQRPQLSRAA